MVQKHSNNQASPDALWGKNTLPLAGLFTQFSFPRIFSDTLEIGLFFKCEILFLHSEYNVGATHEILVDIRPGH